MKEGKIIIKLDEGDRVLLYLEGLEDYHIIASKAEGATLKAGDRIAYSDYGINFGWFAQKIEPVRRFRIFP